MYGILTYIMNYSKDHNFINPQDFRLPPDERPGEKIHKSNYATQTENKFGVTPRFYESHSKWVEYECKCGNMFWLASPASQARSCRQRKMQCREARLGPVSGNPQLDLMGKEYGSIKVVGHERGKGWKIKCWCGRERFIFGGTALARGAYKTCGQCTEAERYRGAAASGTTATESASNEAESRRKYHVCAAGHQWITYRKVDGEDCPLCLALARIELLA